MNFPVQRISFCQQCERLLPAKCSACNKHPKRKPEVVEYFDYPPFLEVCASGHCARIQCQREGCKETPWKVVARYKGQKARSEKLFCNKKCAGIQRGKYLNQQITVDCACGCGKKFARRPSKINGRMAFFSETHHRYWQIRQSHIAKTKDEDFSLQSIYCEICKTVTDHEHAGQARSGMERYLCNVCHAVCMVSTSGGLVIGRDSKNKKKENHNAIVDDAVAVG